MGYIVSFSSLIIGLINHIKIRTWVNPTSLFCYLWSVVSLLAALRIYGIDEVSTKTWSVIMLGIISFAIGATFKLDFKKNEYNFNQESELQLIKPKHYWIIFCVVVIPIAGEVIDTIRLIQQGYQLSTIRMAKLGLEEVEGYSRSKNITVNYLIEIAKGLSTILVAVGIEYYFSLLKNNTKYLAAALVLIIFDAISEGGRWVLAYAAIEFVVCYYLMKEKNKYMSKFSMKRKTKIGLVSAVIVIVLAVNKITSLRSINNTKQHFLLYLCGCIPLLDKKMDYLQDSSTLSFSYSGLYGAWSYIMPYVNKIIGCVPRSYEEALNVRRNAQSFDMISNNIQFNAFSTSFYYLFADMRWIGVFIGMFIFGALANMIFINAREVSSYSINSVAPYLIVSQMIIKTIQIYPLASPAYIVVIVSLLIIYKINNKKISQ